MRSEKLRTIKKIAMLGAMFIMVLALCGCRQRITNNTEVSNTLYDADGSKSYEYQYRRDELSLSQAKRPIFPDLGSSTEEAEEETYEDYGETENFEDTANQEEEEYDDEDHSTTPKTKTGTGGRKVGRISHRGGTGGSSKNLIKVTLDPNGGKVEVKEIYAVKDKTYGELPVPEFAGYSFLGWYTEKTDGNAVTEKTKVETDKAHTLYAHWKEANTYTVTFDPNGGKLSDDNTMVISANSKYGYLPKPQYEGYVFDGWYTSADGGNLVKKGDSFKEEKDITLYAHWKEDKYTYWDSYYGDTAKLITSETEYPCLVDSEDKDEKSFLADCKGHLPKDDEQAAYVIKFVKKMSDADTVGKDALEANPGTTVIVVPSEALKGSKEEKLLYKYQVFSAIYGEDFEGLASANDMKSDLELKSDDIKIYK